MSTTLLNAMSEEKQTNKRKDSNYKQVIGYVHVDIVSKFRALCIKKGVNVSEGLEDALNKWNESNSD